MTIAICAVVCGADDWVEVGSFGRGKEKWLRRSYGRLDQKAAFHMVSAWASTNRMVLGRPKGKAKILGSKGPTR